MISVRTLASAVVAVIASAISLLAQGSLTSGAYHVGSIAPSGDVDGWTFSGTAGQRVALRIVDTGGVNFFGPHMRLFDPDGVNVAASGGSVVGTIAHNLAKTGTYTVSVSDGSATGDETGSYRLQFVLAPGAHVIPDDDEGGELLNGGARLGAIFLGDLDAWTFTATAGERILLRVAETGTPGDFSPYCEVIDPDGVWLSTATGSIVGSSFFNAEKSGTYTVVVRDTSFTTGASTGTYALQFVRAPGEFVVPEGDEGGALVAGAANEGTITVGDLDTWTFTATAGERILLRVAETGTPGDFSPYCEVIDPDGVWLSTATGSIVGSQFFNAAKTGTYRVVVRDTSFTIGANAGSYALQFLQTPGEFVVPLGDEGGPLVAGVANVGAITVGDLDPWTFTATAGERISLRVAETGTPGDFSPYCEVIDPDGVWLYSATGSIVGSSFFNAAKTGTYTVVVRDTSFAIGANSGTYALQFVQTPGGFQVPPGDEGGALVAGAANVGTIAVGDLDAWTVSATAGDRISLRIAETGTAGDFSPYSEVLDPDGVWIFTASGSVVGSSFFNAGKTGTYTVVVRDSSFSIGASAGTYALQYFRTPGSFIVPAGDEGGAAGNGVFHSGAITLGDCDAWTMHAAAGETLRFRVTEVGTPGNFSPYFELLSPTGVWLTTGSGSVTAENSHTATVTGTYTIILRDESFSTGASVGSYQLFAANLSHGYLGWLATHFSAQMGNPAMEATVWGPAADPDADGVRNLVEYYLGRNPNSRESAATWTQMLTPDALVCEFRRKAGSLAATGAVQWSTDLANWSSAGVIYDAPVPDGGFEIVRAYVPLQPGVKLFARLHVTANP